MAINGTKVLVGGLAAGVVMNIIDFLNNAVLFGKRMTADANAFKPGLGDRMAAMDGATAAKYILMDFVVAMLLVFTYAAMRPRFGPGPKTAIIVGVVFWLFGCILTSTFLTMGMMSSGLWWSFSLVYLISLTVAAIVGGWVYSEKNSTA